MTLLVHVLATWAEGSLGASRGARTSNARVGGLGIGGGSASVPFRPVCSNVRLSVPKGGATPGDLNVTFGGGCDVAQFTHEAVLRGLRGRRLMFVGDDVSRYEFLALASFLVHGEWDRDLDQKFAENWPTGWGSYLRESSAALGPDAICDCYRGADYRSEAFALHKEDCGAGRGPDSEGECPISGVGVIENRYVRIAAADIALSFHYHPLPREPVFWHEPSWLGVDCADGAGGHVAPTPPGDVCPQRGCVAGRCRIDRSPSATDPWRVRREADAVGELLATLKPDTLVIHMGSSSFNAPLQATESSAIARSAAGAVAAGYLRRAIWRSAYAVRPDSSGWLWPEPAHNRENWLKAARMHGQALASGDAALAARITGAFSVTDGHAVSDALAVESKKPGVRMFMEPGLWWPPVYKWFALATLTDLLNAADTRNGPRQLPVGMEPPHQEGAGYWGISHANDRFGKKAPAT